MNLSGSGENVGQITKQISLPPFQIYMSRKQELNSAGLFGKYR